MAKMFTRRVIGILRCWIALALPTLAVALPSPGAATARAEPETDAVIVREIGGVLYFAERGALLPVPAGPAASVLRDLLHAAGENGVLGLDVGHTVVADGGSGWHGSDRKP